MAGDQALVAWQSSQALVVARWLDDLPVALVPLWHDEQVPVILLWLKFAGVHAVVAWQVEHSEVVAI